MHKIVLTSDRLKSSFAEELAEVSGENVLECYQCGKCTAGCPLAFSMDLLPHEVMRMAQLNQEELILNSKTIWVCVSCLNCQEICPMEIGIPNVMEALRTIVLRRTEDKVCPDKLKPELVTDAPQMALVSGMRKFTL
jgi:heterodisulfide reductase subunit C